MSNAVAILRDAFPGARWRGDTALVRCPAHEDRKASLSLKIEPGGKILVYCHAGCGLVDILAPLGLTPRDLFPSNGNGNGHGHAHPKPAPAPVIVATYDYTDADGELRYQVARYRPKDFRQRRPDGKGGWIWDLDGVERVPYRLPELLAADPEAWVFITEGEKDADNVAALGLVATTNAGGAGKWEAAWARHFRGRKVAVLADNDPAGRAGALKVAASLYGLTRRLVVVEFAELPQHGDVGDWLALGHGREDLLYRAEAAPEWAPAADPCGAELAAAQLRIAELEAKLAESEAARAEEAAAHAAHLRAIQAVVTHKAWKDGDKVFALRLGPRLIAAQERADGDDPPRLPVRSISAEIGHGRHADSERVKRFAALGILEASLEGELRVSVDRTTGEVVEKPGQAYHQRTEARNVAEFYSRVAAAQPEKSNHGGWRWDGKTCRTCGHEAVETHTHGICTNCGQRYKDGVPVGGVRTPPNPLLDQVDPIRESGRDEGETRPPVTFFPLLDQLDPPTAPASTPDEIAFHRALHGRRTLADIRGRPPPT